MKTKTKKLLIAGALLISSVMYGYTTLQREAPWQDGVFYEVSSDVLSLVYYRADSETLTLAFRKGPVYEYSGVPAPVFQALMNTPRKGVFYNQRIRGHFPSCRLELSAPGETI